MVSAQTPSLGSAQHNAHLVVGIVVGSRPTEIGSCNHLLQKCLPTIRLHPSSQNYPEKGMSCECAKLFPV